MANQIPACRAEAYFDGKLQSLSLIRLVCLYRVSILENREPRTDILLCVCLSNRVIVFVWMNLTKVSCFMPKSKGKPHEVVKQSHFGNIEIFGAGTIMAIKCKTELIHITVM